MKNCQILSIGGLKWPKYKILFKLIVNWSDGAVNVLGIEISENLEYLCAINQNNKLKKRLKRLQP